LVAEQAGTYPEGSVGSTAGRGCREHSEMVHMHERYFRAKEHLDEFRAFLASVEWTDRNPLNTEMFFLWSMVRSLRPELFIESGTYMGYSATFICEALKRNGNDPRFYTFGLNLDNCIPFARRRLAAYPFAEVVEGDSRELIRGWSEEIRPTAFFIDGPKGRNMFPLFFSISKRFSQVQFIAVHDCYIGHWNRSYLLQFYGREYPVMFSDSHFQEEYAFLDDSLVDRSERWKWRPHFFNGKIQESYGTETGYVLPEMGRLSTGLSRLILILERRVRFDLYLRILPIIKTMLRVVFPGGAYARQ
jgi:hypothetical protein